jgi:hypothetical protein
MAAGTTTMRPVLHRPKHRACLCRGFDLSEPLPEVTTPVVALPRLFHPTINSTERAPQRHANIFERLYTGGVALINKRVQEAGESSFEELHNNENDRAKKVAKGAWRVRASQLEAKAAPPPASARTPRATQRASTPVPRVASLTTRRMQAVATDRGERVRSRPSTPTSRRTTPASSPKRADKPADKSAAKPAAKPAATKKAAETAPAKSETAPAKSETAPAKSETEPAKSETAPAKAETEPAKAETAPAKSETEPAKSETAPAKSETEPAKAEPEPAKADPSPPHPEATTATEPSQSAAPSSDLAEKTESKPAPAGVQA